MSDAVLIEKRGAIAALTLNLPDKRNAMTAELTDQFVAAIDDVRVDPDLKALVVTGAGRAFCAGGDFVSLRRKLDTDPETNRREMGRFYRLYLSLLHLDIPTIAAINGAAIGAGLSVALACDIRLAARSAKLGSTFLNLGLHPGMASTHLLPILIGHARAAELLFTGDVIDADTAARIGLVNRVVPAEDLAAEALALAETIAEKPAAALRMTKRALARQKIAGLEAALDYEAIAQAHSYASADMRALLAQVSGSG